MRTAPGPRPARRASPAARAAVLALCAAALAACDAPPPTWRQLPASTWARRLGSRDAKESEEAQKALVGFAAKRPDLVVAAVADELSREAPAPLATPFSLAVDRDAERRLGLEPAGGAEIARVDLPVLRARAEALGLPVTSWRSVADGQVDVGLAGHVPRARIERAQRVLATRGALLVRGADAGAPALDDAMVAGASVERTLEGRPFLVLRLRVDRIEDARGALAGAGPTVVVLVDGEERGRVPTPVVARDRVALPLWREGGADADAQAADLAVVLGAGRLERPLRPAPLSADAGVGPPAENPWSQTLVAIGAPAAPTLERLAKEAPHEWTRRSAAWALTQVAPR